MKITRLLLSVLLSLLFAFSPLAARAEDMQTDISVPIYIAYERAEQAGMYINVSLADETEKRMRTRLGQIIARYQDHFGADEATETGKTVVDGWFASTKYNIAENLFVISEGTSGALRVNPNYLRMYDFIAIRDASGRAMLYPFQQYAFDLYGDICDAAVSELEELLLPVIQSSFTTYVETLEDTAAQAALRAAFETAFPNFHLTADDVRLVLTQQTVIRDDITIESATSLISDLSVSNLGAYAPVTVATENTDAAWYKLTLSGESLSGVKLETPVSLSEIKSTTTSSAILWLNERGELIYLTASRDWLSADAATLSAALAERGGTGAQTAVKAPDNSADAPVKSGGALWYVLSAIAAIVLVLLVVALLRKSGGRRRYGGPGAGSVEPEEDKEDEETKES